MRPVAWTVVDTAAAPATVDRLLTDTTAWRVWSPHVADVVAAQPRITEGWEGRVRAFFSPVATTMRVTWAAPGRGYDWESTVGPWTLHYRNRVEPADGGARLEWSADLSGPAVRLVVPVVRRLSALGQRRRVARLARTAELVDVVAAERGGAAPGG